MLKNLSQFSSSLVSCDGIGEKSPKGKDGGKSNDGKEEEQLIESPDEFYSSFPFFPGQQVYLKSSNAKYLSCRRNGDLSGNADKSDPGSVWELCGVSGRTIRIKSVAMENMHLGITEEYEIKAIPSKDEDLMFVEKNIVFRWYGSKSKPGYFRFSLESEKNLFLCVHAGGEIGSPVEEDESLQFFMIVPKIVEKKKKIELTEGEGEMDEEEDEFENFMDDLPVDIKYSKLFNKRSYYFEEYVPRIKKKDQYEIKVYKRYILEALMLTQDEKFQLAMNRYEKAIEHSPADFIAYLNRGILRKNHLKSNELALEDLNMAINLCQEKNARGYYSRAMLNIFTFLNQSQGLKDVDTALGINPHEPEYLFRKSILYNNNKNTKVALKDINRAIKLQIIKNKDFVEKNKYSFEKNDHKEERDSLVKRNDKILAKFYFHRAVILSKDGKFVEALQQYSEAIRIFPEYYQAYFNRGNINRDQYSNYQLAIDDFSKALKYKPNYKSALINRSAIYNVQLHNYIKALEDLTYLLDKVDPNYLAALINRAGLYEIRFNKYEEALKDYEKAIAILDNESKLTPEERLKLPLKPKLIESRNRTRTRVQTDLANNRNVRRN